MNLPYRWTDVVVKMILDKSTNNAGFPNTGVLVQRSCTKNRLILVLVPQETVLPPPEDIYYTVLSLSATTKLNTTLKKHHSNIVVNVNAADTHSYKPLFEE